jgi:hypothetical protein
MHYRHTQFGTAMVVSLLIGIAVIVVLIALTDLHWVTIPVLVFLAVMLPLFYSLTVEIDEERLRFRFGVGPLGKTIPLSEIEKAEPVTNRWSHGWGIHRTPQGWLYNVSGLDAVEVTLKSGERLRIGTDRPTELVEAINRATEER